MQIRVGCMHCAIALIYYHKHDVLLELELGDCWSTELDDDDESLSLRRLLCWFTGGGLT